MSPRAPLRSRTVGCPKSGSGLGSDRHFPEAGLLRPSKAQAMARVHPRCPWFTCPLAPIPSHRELPALRLGAGRVIGTAECPEPLCPPRVLPATGRPPGPPRGTLLPLQSSYGLMRQSHRLSPPSLTSCVESSQVAAIPCWSWDLPDIIPGILAEATGPIPRRVSQVHSPISSLGAPASRFGKDVRHTGRPLQCDFDREPYFGAAVIR
jgi:hypothetical protein